MDASALTSNVGDEESLKRQKITSDEDIISNLPESILSHILSFLPTKYAVQTSVLSTKWKYVWTSVTSLHFDDQLFYSTKGRLRRGYFINSVNRVLRQSGNSNIQSFHLSCGRGYRASRVNVSISAALRRKVQRLHVHHYDEGFFYPVSLFTCDSLIELSLRMFCTLKVPTSICFSTLKFLELFKVKLLNEDSLSKQLLLSFPVLKVLNLSFCTWLNVENVDISAPVLDCFTLKYSKWTHSGSSDCVIKICAPCFTKFRYEGLLSEDIILPSPQSIIDAAVEIVTERANVDQMCKMGFRASNLLRNFSNVKYLTLSTDIVRVLACVEDLATHMLSFDKLTHLKLSSLMGLRSLSKTVMALFQSSPNLECLIFVGGISCCWDSDDVLALEMVPQCFLSHLKVVIYQNFDGTEPELSIVKFLLKNLKVLEEMIITASLKLNAQKPKPKMEKKVKKCKPSPPEIPEIEKEEVKKQLLSFPKASSHASIVFS